MSLDYAHVWGYVLGGYGITAGVLVSYAVWVQKKLRRARRSVREGGE